MDCPFKILLNLSVNADSICDLTKPCKVFKEDFAIEATYQLVDVNHEL